MLAPQSGVADESRNDTRVDEPDGNAKDDEHDDDGNRVVLELALGGPGHSVHLGLDVCEPAADASEVLLLGSGLLGAGRGLRRGGLLGRVDLGGSVLLLELLALGGTRLAGAPLLAILVGHSYPFGRGLVQSWKPAFRKGRPVVSLAGQVGLEPTTNGFGDRRTTAVLFPYEIVSAESLTKAIIA